MLAGLFWELVVVLSLTVLVFFGPKRLPEISAALGSSIREFRKAVTGTDQPAVKGPEPSSDTEHDTTRPHKTRL
jgi:sec-independent protein translocase protein TatA